VTDQNSGASHIYNERARQVVQEGYDAEHDKGHHIELLDAAIGYAAFASASLEIQKDVQLGRMDSETAESLLAEGRTLLPPNWPWGRTYWKPSEDIERNLVKAGALIAAAIDSIRSTSHEDLEPLFTLHDDPIPEGLEGAILDPKELMFRAIAGDAEAQLALQAAAEQHGVHLAFTPEQLITEMAARGTEIPPDVMEALQNLSEDGGEIRMDVHPDPDKDAIEIDGLRLTRTEAEALDALIPPPPPPTGTIATSELLDEAEPVMGPGQRPSLSNGFGTEVYDEDGIPTSPEEERDA
jgi:hypothetical protein